MLTFISDPLNSNGARPISVSSESGMLYELTIHYGLHIGIIIKTFIIINIINFIIIIIIIITSFICCWLTKLYATPSSSPSLGDRVVWLTWTSSSNEQCYKNTKYNMIFSWWSSIPYQSSILHLLLLTNFMIITTSHRKSKAVAELTHQPLDQGWLAWVWLHWVWPHWVWPHWVWPHFHFHPHNHRGADANR